MNNNDDKKSDIIQDIDAFLNEGGGGGEEKSLPVPVEDKARAAFLARPLPPPRRLPLSRIGVVEAKPGKYKDTDTGEEWEVPNFTYDSRTPDVPQTPGDILKYMKQKGVLNTLETQFYDMERQEWEEQIDLSMEEAAPAVIVVGESGVGKTTMIENEAAKHNLKVAYFNAPTMDPYLQLVGIPYVRTDLGKACLQFVRKHDLEHVDMIFLDEINRVSKAVQNQLFELVAAHQINGVPFRRLRSVWAAINPPREDINRAVQELEDALAGRFFHVIHVEAAPKIHHYAGPRDQIGMKVAETCLSWWYSEIKGKQGEGKDNQTVNLQDVITPRVLYYIMWTVQRLNNAMYHPGKDEKGNPIPPISEKRWNAGFNRIAQHHKLSSKTWGVNMPFEQLKRALHGHEIVALSMLRNDSAEIERWEQLVQADQVKGLELADKLEAALRKTTLGGPAEIPMNELGDFSRILVAMHKDAAGKVVGRQEVAWYLWAKVHKTPAERQAIAAKAGNPDDPIALPMTNGEKEIYEHCKPIIDRIIQTNIEQGQAKRQPVGRAPVAPGGPKIAGGLGGGPSPAGGGGAPKMPFGTAPRAKSGGIQYTP